MNYDFKSNHRIARVPTLDVLGPPVLEQFTRKECRSDLFNC